MQVCSEVHLEGTVLENVVWFHLAPNEEKWRVFL
jgi:hypothetical protein